MKRQPIRTAATITKLLVAAALCVIVWTAPKAHPVEVDAPVNPLTTYNCWSGTAPRDMAGVIPPHALIDTADGPELVDSSIGFDIWTGKRSGVLLGFCL